MHRAALLLLPALVSVQAFALTQCTGTVVEPSDGGAIEPPGVDPICNCGNVPPAGSKWCAGPPGPPPCMCPTGIPCPGWCYTDDGNLYDIVPCDGGDGG